jgi:hypothetical protein
MQLATLMPQEELRSRLAKVSELSKKMVSAVSRLPWKSA